MRFSIRLQILIPLILLLVGLVGISAWAASNAAQTARNSIAQQIDGVEATLSQARYPLTDHVLEQMKGLSGADYLLLDPAGRRSGTLKWPGATLPGSMNQPGLGTRLVLDDGAFFWRPVALKPPHPDAGSTLYILYPEASVTRAQAQAIRPILLLGGSASLMAIVLTLLLGQSLVRRMGALERSTKRIAGGDFSPMPLPTRHDEIQSLARSINEMAEKLAQMRDAIGRAERLRLLGQVAGGLAHQLRNAVTGAKLAIQLHAQTCTGGDAEALEVADRQLARMALDLQRFFDLGQDSGKRAQCDLVSLADEVVTLLQPQARHTSVDLRWSPPVPSAEVVGDSGALGHMILNVVSNAVEAAAAGGKGGWVAITLEPSQSEVIVQVRDSGPGPAATVAPRLFEPFVTGKTGGVGLGLAVAREVVDSHGGSIAWQREPDATCFRIVLPRES